VVVDCKPSVLVAGPRSNIPCWQEILNFRESLELARSSRSPSLLVEIALGQLLPSYRSRQTIQSRLQDALHGETDRLGVLNRTCQRNWTLNEGANIATRNPAFTGALDPDPDRRYLSRRFYCHPVNAEYIHRLLSLAGTRGIPVYWLLPPLCPELQSHREHTGAEAGLVRFVRSLQARHPGVTVLDARHAGYDHTLFVDATHLDRQGACTLSRDVAQVLAQDRDRGSPGHGIAAARSARWIALPACQPCPVAVTLEDVEQSRQALRASR
jgi:hypothetical protein